jgi:iron complex outermembrane recepter protein
MTTHKSRSLVAAIALALGSQAVYAADMLEEIVVTAQKRTQNIQDVGIAITAVTGEQMSALGIVDSTDLVQIIPGLRNPKSGGGFTSSYSLRGMSQSDYGGAQEAPVALYVDEVYQASQGAAAFLTFDLDRVEVLRGPQGTLFGRNATGGLVHFVTARPTEDANGYVDLSYGRFNEVKFEGAVNQPLSDNWAARLSFASDTHDPIVHNLNGPDMWNRNEQAARLQFLYKAGDDFSFLLSLHGGERRNRGQPYIWSAARPTGFGGTGVSTPGLADYYGFTHPDDPLTVNIDPVSHFWSQTDGATATLTWKFGGATLTSITDANHVHVDYVEDSDMDVGEFYHFYGIQNVNQFSEELRLNGETQKMRWVTGLYFLNVDGNFDYSGHFAALGYPGTGAEDTIYATKTRTWSLFAQTEYDLAPHFRGILGARLIHDHKSEDYDVAFVDHQGGTKVPFGSSPDLYLFNGAFDDTNVSLKAELDWLPREHVLGYVSFNRGIKSGGFNSPLDPSGSAIFIDPTTFDPAPTANAAMRYKPEVLNAYEIGLKTTSANGKLRSNTAVFYYDYHDFQGYNFVGLTNFIENHDAKMHGFDTELTASPTKGLEILLGASYLVDIAHGISVGDLVLDRQMPYAPRWNLTGLVRYEWAVREGTMSVQMNANHLSTQYHSLSNAADIEEAPYTVANVRIAYVAPGGRLTVAAYCENLGNTWYRQTAFDTAAIWGSAEALYGLPRTYGINFRYNWGK